MPSVVLQSPCAEQSAGHVRSEQSTEVKPASHAHVLSALHEPWPEQSLTHFGSEQSVPVKRRSHEQVPLRQVP